jgi:asparagine synthase (glutamine-hydrolysing)
MAMACHAGAFFFDMRPADAAGARLEEALRALAPDAVSLHREAGIAMAFAACPAWRGDRSTRQPFISHSSLAILWDGRLDNRDDLLLQLCGAIHAGASDVAIAATVFERWGVDGFRRLVGEWSATIWDPRHRILYLARDYIGVRPLFYCSGPGWVMWSTDVGELALRCGRIDALSERFVAGFMTLRFSGSLTPYEGVHSVPPGQCVSFRADRVREARTPFWELSSGIVRYRDPHDYEDHLRALWRDAVRQRLRVDQGSAVWAELSGGLDSSSVVCMADALVKHGAAPGASLHIASHATLESPEGDERRFIADVEGQCGLRAAVLGVEAHDALIDDRWGWVTPFAARGVGLARARFVEACGGRIVLSGRAGDAVMGGETDNSSAVLDDFADGSVFRALCSMRQWSRATRKPFVEIAWRLLRPRLDFEAARATEQSRAPGGLSAIRSLRPELQRHSRALAIESSHAMRSALSEIRPAKRPLAAMLLGYAFDSRLNLPHQPPALVFSYPFTHRPLVEYVMAIPGDQLSAPGEPRSLMRRAFAGFVPARILARRSKGYYPPSSARSIRRALSSLPPPDRLESVARGWIEPAIVEALIASVRDGGGHGSGELRRIMRLEEWLHARHRRAPADIPRREEVNSDEVLNA